MTTTHNTVEFELRELIRAAEMSGLNPQQIPSDVNPWTWRLTQVLGRTIATIFFPRAP